MLKKTLKIILIFRNIYYLNFYRMHSLSYMIYINIKYMVKKYIINIYQIVNKSNIQLSGNSTETLRYFI